MDYGDLKWSLLSNTFFIFGGFYESMDAIWDILDENGQYDTNNYHTNRKSIWSILRIAIGLLGPIVYLSQFYSGYHMGYTIESNNGKIVNNNWMNFKLI